MANKFLSQAVSQAKRFMNMTNNSGLRKITEVKNGAESESKRLSFDESRIPNAEQYASNVAKQAEQEVSTLEHDSTLEAQKMLDDAVKNGGVG